MSTKTIIEWDKHQVGQTPSGTNIKGAYGFIANLYLHHYGQTSSGTIIEWDKHQG